jgi:hypothetical protein
VDKQAFLDAVAPAIQEIAETVWQPEVWDIVQQYMGN